MPVIKVYGVPEGIMSPVDLAGIVEHLQISTVGVEELKIKRHQVTVFFPKDHLAVGLGQEIIAEVSTASKPERTPEVLARLAREVGMILRLGFPDARLVEVFITTHDPKSQFWKSENKPVPAPSPATPIMEICEDCLQPLAEHPIPGGCGSPE